MLKYFLSRQFAGFLLVGGSAAFLHWIARILLSLTMPYAWAVFFAYGVGMGIAFALNSWYVFPKSDKPVRKQARDFLAINLLFLPVVWIASLLLKQWLIGQGVVRYPEEIAHAIAITLPVMATFLFYKFFAFRENYYG
ncbi:MAG: GtrA family protein [Halieaceae bacterium]|jgi:putative flippase GtrA|nr:GtrA family protein [Halieaceae bacterium]